MGSCKHLFTGDLFVNHLRKIVTFGHKKEFDDVLLILNILRIVPVSNATVECCFSTKGIIKGDWRPCLGEHGLNQMIRIKREGSKISDAKAQELYRRAAVVCFRKSHVERTLFCMVSHHHIRSRRANLYCRAAVVTCWALNDRR
jgi:hypothetical protein